MVQSSLVNPPGIGARTGGGSSSRRDLRRPPLLLASPGAVGQIDQHPHRGVLVLHQCQPDECFVVVGAAGLGQRAVADDPGVMFDRATGFEAVLAAMHRLVGVAGVGIHHRDHPIAGHLDGSASWPATSANRASASAAFGPRGLFGQMRE